MGAADLLLLPFLLFFPVSLMLFSLLQVTTRRINIAYDTVFNQTAHDSAFLFGTILFQEAGGVAQWSGYLAGHLILIGLSILYWIRRLISFPAQLFFSGMIFTINFYWFLFGPSSRRRGLISILSVSRKGMTRKKLRANVDRHRIRPLRASLYVHSNYQVQGAYAHLGQQSVSDLIEAISLATKTFQFSDDPISLDVMHSGGLGIRTSI